MGAEGSEEPQKGEDDDSFDAFWHPESGGHQQPAKTAAQQPRRSPPTCINAQQKQPLSPSPDHPTTSTSNGGSPPAKRMRRTRSSARLIVEQPKSSSGISGFPALLQKSQLQILIRIQTVHREFDPLIGTVLRLRGEQVGSGSRTSRPELVAILRDSWFLTPVKKGNTLRLIEPRRTSENVFEVDDTQGLAILEPDTLISGTAFSQAMYCPRKALFADRFRASGSNLAMTVGTIAHELFQIALTKRPSDLSAKSLFELWRRRFLPSVCLDLIGMQCSLERFEEELRPYLDNIARWIKIHIPSTNPQSQQQKPIAHIRKTNSEIEQDNNVLNELDPEPVYFAATRDIEENVWMPTLGIKGRIDVSFIASSKLSNAQVSSSQESPMVMPLELKTGKSYGTVASIEHHSQVLMYTMMLAERANGGRIGPGFLLYLRDNALVEVQPKALQLRGLLQMRNRIAVHFARFALDSFPEPLKESRMCRFCPYTTLCGALLNNNIDEGREAETGEEEEIIFLGTPEKKQTKRTEIDMDDKENIPPTNTDQSPIMINGHSVQKEEQFELTPEMRIFLDDAMMHLRPAEMVYTRQWIRRTLEEWDAANQKGSTKRLFTQSSAEREKLGTCMTNMELINISTATPNDADWALEETFLLQFRKANGFCKSTKISLEPGSVVTVSTDHSFALLIATVDSIDTLDFIITLRSDKCLPVDPKTPPAKPLYHLDKHDGFSAFALRLGAIGTLLENTPQATKLRSILTIGHANLDGTKLPVCSTTPLKYIGAIVEQDHQQQQLLRALNTPDYAIVKGPDKKETSSFLVVFATLLLRQQKSVLFCANSNATVDELLLQLVAKGLPRDQLLRIGASKALHPDAVILSLDNKLETDLELLKTDTEAKAYYCRVQALIEKKPLFVTSTLSSVSSHAFFVASGHFDFCLIDDPFGSLADSTLIAPLLRSDRFVLFTTAKAVKTQPENSLIARLESMMIAAGDSSRLITLQTENLGPEKLEDGGAEKTHSTPKTVEKKQTKQRPKIKKTLFDFWCQKPKSTKK